TRPCCFATTDRWWLPPAQAPPSTSSKRSSRWRRSPCCSKGGRPRHYQSRSARACTRGPHARKGNSLMPPTTVSLFSGLAVKDILEESVLPAFRAESGVEVEATYEPTKVLSALIA